jgi:hypothetical protein
MKVVAIVLLQFTLLYCIAKGNQSLQSDQQAAVSASLTADRVSSARDQLLTALSENRDIVHERRLFRAAIWADFAAEARLTQCAQRDWAYRALLGVPILGE